jgi:hypothetical protein
LHYRSCFLVHMLWFKSALCTGFVVMFFMRVCVCVCSRGQMELKWVQLLINLLLKSVFKDNPWDLEYVMFPPSR